MARKKETVESLRKKIKEMKGSLTYEQEDRPRMYHHREDLRAKVNTAIERLSCISSGAVLTPDIELIGKENLGDSTFVARRTAGIGLQKIALMQERKA